MSALLDKLTRAAEQAAGCKVKHMESSPVVETFNGAIVWEGVVEIFGISKPPPALVYAWAVEGDKGPQYVTVLDKPPVVSAITAVRAWLVSQARK